MRPLVWNTAVASLVAAAGIFALGRAQAEPDKPAPDKGQYTLFDPVPEKAMRGFNTDRPTKSNVPWTVDAGHFQYETDLFNYSRQKTGPIKTDTWLVPNPTLKVGLTINADLEFNIAPYEGIHTRNLSTGMSNTVTGPGDLYTRLKINLWGNEGGQTAFALIPYVKAPTAPIGIGNGAVEGGVITPLAISLPNNYTLLFVPEVDVLRDSLGGGNHVNVVNLVNINRQVIENVTVYAELWSAVNLDPVRTIKQYSFDTAVAWTFRPNAQVDVGLNIGLNRDTAAVQVYAGVAQRF